MSNEQKPNQGSLVPSGNSRLVARSSGLVRRGLYDMARLTITSKQIEKICSDLHKQKGFFTKFTLE